MNISLSVFIYQLLEADKLCRRRCLRFNIVKGYAHQRGLQDRERNGYRVLLHTHQIIRQEDAAKSFEQLWSDAAQAEESRFDHLWLGDSVTVLDKARGDCLTTMSALSRDSY